jgi:hypothetical protein
MPSISCFYHRLFYQDPNKIIFIKFENFVKIIFKNKCIILTNKDLTSNQRLFELFLLSLLVTKDTSKINSMVANDKIIYGVETMKYERSRFADYYKIIKISNIKKNPLNAVEPKRASGNKKFRKFIKLFNEVYKTEIIKEPLIMMEEFYYIKHYTLFDYFRNYIDYENRIINLSMILHNYGRDIYISVRRFL